MWVDAQRDGRLTETIETYDTTHYDTFNVQQKLTSSKGDAENARQENAGLENAALICRAGNYRTGKCGKQLRMVYLMSPAKYEQFTPCTVCCNRQDSKLLSLCVQTRLPNMPH